MATNRQWREEFIARMSREGMRLELIRALLRNAATLDWLACAQCNGDWPYNGDRDRPSACNWDRVNNVPIPIPGAEEARARWDRRYLTCPRCEASGVARSAMRKDHTAQKIKAPGAGYLIPLVCPDCRTADRVRALLAGSGWVPVFGGDPRGCVLKVARECSVMEYPAGEWSATIKRDHGHSTERETFPTEAEARAWWQAQLDNGRAEARGDVIGVPS